MTLDEICAYAYRPLGYSRSSTPGASLSRSAPNWWRSVDKRPKLSTSDDGGEASRPIHANGPHHSKEQWGPRTLDISGHSDSAKPGSHASSQTRHQGASSPSCSWAASTR